MIFGGFRQTHRQLDPVSIRRMTLIRTARGSASINATAPRGSIAALAQMNS